MDFPLSILSSIVAAILIAISIRLWKKLRFAQTQIRLIQTEIKIKEQIQMKWPQLSGVWMALDPINEEEKKSRLELDQRGVVALGDWCRFGNTPYKVRTFISPENVVGYYWRKTQNESSFGTFIIIPNTNADVITVNWSQQSTTGEVHHGTSKFKKTIEQIAPADS